MLYYSKKYVLWNVLLPNAAISHCYTNWTPNLKFVATAVSEISRDPKMLK